MRHRERTPAATLIIGAAVWLASLPARPAPLPGPAAPAARTPASFSFDSTPGRLPKTVVPQRYAIALAPDVEHRSLEGRESITLQFRSSSATILFDSLHETLRDVRLDGVPVQAVSSDDAHELTRVTLAAAAARGMHQLSFSYTGRIETQALGLYLQHYRAAGGRPALILSTQLEATDARRMFPCWDEPAFRAHFQLTVTVPSTWVAVSNMPIASRRVHGALATTAFEATPSMPSYLLELSAGELREVATRAGDVTLGVWAQRGREREGLAALANARQILADYDGYFAYPYPLPKLDSIAVPNGFNGGMENWGAITYDEGLLLLPPLVGRRERAQTFSLQAHEMAHQWTGDLVAIDWWNELWLSEGLASWMAARETELRNPGWNGWQVDDADKEAAMRVDALTSATAIESPASDELQAASGFDLAITYSKGQAVLRMLEAYLGADVFRDGMRRYIRAHAFSNATAGDLWRALSAASGRNVASVAAPWTQQPGLPLITVTAHCGSDGARTIVLSQQRFLLQGRPGGAAWQVPLRIRTAADGLPEPRLLTRQDQRLRAGRCTDPLSINAGDLGYYRVRYDSATLAVNARHLARLPATDRAALLDDQWALVQSGTGPLASYLALASAMGADLDARAWEQVTGALGTIEYAERGSSGHDAFAAYARSILRPAAEQLVRSRGGARTPDRSSDIAQLRESLLQDLGSWGDQVVINHARQRFRSFLQRPAHARAPLPGLILLLVGLDADQRRFDELHALARHAGDEAERQRDYLAMMQVRDPKLAAQAARIVASDEIPLDEPQLRLSLITALAARHPQLAWTAFTAQADMLLAPYASLAPLITAEYVPDWFGDGVPPEQLAAWVRARIPAELQPLLARSLDLVRFRRSEKTALTGAADAYLRARTRGVHCSLARVTLCAYNAHSVEYGSSK